MHDGALLAQPRSVAVGRLTGEPKILAEGLTAPGWLQDGRFSASPDMLVYLNVLDPFPVSKLRISDCSGRSIAPWPKRSDTRGRAVARGLAFGRRNERPPSPACYIWVLTSFAGTETVDVHLATIPRRDAPPMDGG